MKQQTTATPRKSRRKQVMIGLSLATISVCLAIFILELAARLLPVPYPANAGRIFACDNSLGWTGIPNFRGEIEDPAYRQKLTFNSLGMHDTEHALEKHPDDFRILLLGDSFIQAVQVSEADASHQVLENRLNRETHSEVNKFEVLSGGVVHWGTNQQLIYYQEQGRRFQPNLVLLAFYIGNDFADNLPGSVMTTHGLNCYAPYFTMCDGELNATSVLYAPGLNNPQNSCSPVQRTFVNSMGWLYQRSRLYQQIEPLFYAKQSGPQFGATFPSPFTALYLSNSEPELEQSWQITQAAISQLQQEVEADGARFAVALISPDIIVRLGLLSPAEQELFLQDNPSLLNAEIDRPNQRMGEFLNSQNIPFIDLTAPMAEYLSTTGNSVPLYLLGEGHWTVEGNRVAAEILAQWLVQNDLLEPAP